jgi:3-oxoacyl-[acyl-carrier-protein] synthase III
MNYHSNLGLSNNSVIKGLGTKILGSGTYLPKHIVTSEDIFNSFSSESKYGIPSDWMIEKMGIIERRMCSANCRPSDLAIPAAKKAIESYQGINIDHIDAVIFCGIERDQPEPATAHEIQRKLGLSAKYAFDVGNACFGFFDGLRIASSLIQSSAARLVLVVTGEVPTKLTTKVVDQLNKGISRKEMADKLGFLSVGDAGAAMIVGQSGDAGLTGFTSFDAQTLSSENDLCYYDQKPNSEFTASMKMARIVSKTLKLQSQINDRAQRSCSWQNPKFLLTHQVGKKAFYEVVKKGIVPEERMIKSYDYFGNVTSATIGLNYQQLVDSAATKEGDVVHGYYSGSGIVAGHWSLRM